MLEEIMLEDYEKCSWLKDKTKRSLYTVCQLKRIPPLEAEPEIGDIVLIPDLEVAVLIAPTGEAQVLSPFTQFATDGDILITDVYDNSYLKLQGDEFIIDGLDWSKLKEKFLLFLAGKPKLIGIVKTVPLSEETKRRFLELEAQKAKMLSLLGRCP